jgi:hypothetical protein
MLSFGMATKKHQKRATIRNGQVTFGEDLGIPEEQQTGAEQGAVGENEPAPQGEREGR